MLPALLLIPLGLSMCGFDVDFTVWLVLAAVLQSSCSYFLTKNPAIIKQMVVSVSVGIILLIILPILKELQLGEIGLIRRVIEIASILMLVWSIILSTIIGVFDPQRGTKAKAGAN